jgi:zinc D-Ala-D-Ala carboxypeptidase
MTRDITTAVVSTFVVVTAMITAPQAAATPEDGSDTTSAAGPQSDVPGDGYLPNGQRLSPFDLSTPAVNRLEPALLDAVQEAARSAAADGITLGLTSGWRSPAFQRQLFADAVAQYGSADIARQYVAAPEMSKHVTGQAVDIGPTDADTWMQRNGQRFGLCQIYANEIWHYELADDHGGTCPPLLPDAAG